MKLKPTIFFVLSIILIFSSEGIAQRSKKDKPITKDSILSGLAFRNIGPAFMSGRIADIEIHPEDQNTMYVAVGSGGVWKTTNAGTTWTPIFDKESSYSIGTITIDPNNTNTIWVGTGEDVGGRHVGYGDGVYKSTDGGATWTNMGLKNSQHIARILVHPDNSNIIWVAAQGPLWNKGGERGLYKSTDGGKNWKKTLGDDEWTGVTDMVMDVNKPDHMYAATWQRHRTVAAYMGGGPKSGLHRSTDGGETWTRLTQGLPEGNMGKIGLAIAHEDPSTLYAAIELDRRTGGVYRSTDKGSSWEKRSNTVSGGTGPHYYQELYASPHHPGRLYLMDNNLQISEDGGKTFYRMNEKNKHGDNHAIAFRKSDPNYLIVGSDGGLYESFDLTKTWRYVENLPVTQYYKVAVDDAEPFYNIYGGTQDNSTQGGPSRTDNVHGIQNSDWSVILNWDGHQPATEPGNPNIVYAERQEGTLSRIDMSTGEVIDIQPQPGANENFERYNWDAPILVSPHSPTTIYFASQRVWKSEDRGDNWTAISGDLTKNEERIQLPIMGRKQSWDSPWDMYAMSNYNTITSLAESPKQKGLIYAGTDDGSIQVTENGGSSWKRIPVSNLPGVPATAFVNDIKADLFDPNTVYVALDNHKYGDFTPYLFKSTNKGNSWTSISNNIPKNTLVWRIVQDHVNKQLLFLATEFGVYTSVNGGNSWIKIQGGAPTISFRDLAIQRRENDLVAASFGRGFFILDDYTPLRTLNETTMQQNAMLFTPRDTWWYVPRSQLSFDSGKGSQGDSHYVAPNPDFGVLFTYYLKEGITNLKDERKKREKEISADIPFPGWESLEEELLETDPKVIIAIYDSSGKLVRKIMGPAKAGIHRINWDLRYPDLQMLSIDEKNDERLTRSGFLAPPGTYKATMYLSDNQNITSLGESVQFMVKPLREGALPGSSVDEVAKFNSAYNASTREVQKFSSQLSDAINKAKALKTAFDLSTLPPDNVLATQLIEVGNDLYSLQSEVNGNFAKQEAGEKGKPTLGDRLFAIYRGIERSTYGPTTMHKQQLSIIDQQLALHSAKLNSALEMLDVIEDKLIKAGAPYIKN